MSRAVWQALAAEPLLTACLAEARRRGCAVWLCGGALRDILLDRPSTGLDLDLAVSGDALALGRGLAASQGWRFVTLKEAFASCRVVAGSGWLDLTGLRAPGLHGDLAARDFTVNAMALPLAALWQDGHPADAIVDPTGGRADLAEGLLRPAGPGVLAADPLRVLRAFRFMASHGFDLAPGLLHRLAGAGPGLFRVPAERIAHEWRKLFAGPKADAAVLAMDRAQVLTRLVPELAFGRGLEQNPFHHRSVLGHSLETLEHACRIVARPGDYFGVLGREVADYLAPGTRRAALLTAALLHDLGKPPTREVRSPGWAAFHRHDIVGSALAARRARALGLSKAEAGLIRRLVAGHMRPFHLLGAERRDGLSRRAVRRLLEFAGEDLPGLMLLALADTMAGRGPQRPADAEHRLIRLYHQVAELRDAELAAALASPPLMDGHRLMDVLGIGPGPLVGRLLGLLREAQLEGRIGDPVQAQELARRLLAKSLDE